MAIADRTRRTTSNDLDLAVLRTQVKDVVTLRGSIDMPHKAVSGGELTQDWLARTLDKGTQARDRFEIASVLENLGAQMGFSSSGLRVRFSARCLREDLQTVLELLFEQLRTPALTTDELAKGKDRLAAAIQRGISDAGYRADVAISRAVYADGHPNYLDTPDEEQALLESLSASDVKDLHGKLLDSRPRLVIVGDIDPDAAEAEVLRAAGSWGGTAQRPVETEIGGATPSNETIEISDRENLEVRWGHPLSLSRLSEDFLPAYLGSFILGGNFSARLMAEIREKRGLTYGIGCGLRGLDSKYTGMWQVHVTLSQDNLAYGVESTEEVVRAFTEGGVTQEELSEKQETLSGAYQVRLATTSGIAGALLQQMEDGRDLSRVDTYPARVRAIRLDQVNDAISAHFNSDKLSRVISGTLPEGS